MHNLDRFVERVVIRLNTDAFLEEEPDLEVKSCYPMVPEAESLWEIADLIASLANSLSVQGLRAVAFGPNPALVRPTWFTDPSVVRDKIQRHFDAAVTPSFEVLAREVGARGIADIFVLTDCSEAPYVTRDAVGGKWVIRLRANTQRRTARRSEVLRLCGHGPARPPSSMQARVEFSSKSTWLLKVRNTGQTVLHGIQLVGTCQFIDPMGWHFNQEILSELRPREEGSVKFHASKRSASTESCRLLLVGKNEDEEPVETTILLNPNEF